MAAEPPSPDFAPSPKVSSINRRSLSIFSRRAPTPTLTLIPTPTVRPVTMHTPPSSTKGSPGRGGMRWKPARSKREAKKTGTILRAVPQADASPAPLSHPRLEQEMVTSPNDEILHAIGRFPPTADDQKPTSDPPVNVPHSPRTYSVKSSKSSRSSNFSPRSRRERTSPFASPELDGTIGVWSNGQVQWESKPAIPIVAHASDAFAKLDSTPTISPPSAAKKNGRPRIQVIIPNDQRSRPFPSLPFFGQNNHNAQSTTADIISGVSPPSGSRNLPLRTSAVSPLVAQRPIPVRPFGRASSHLARMGPLSERPMSAHRPNRSMSTSDEDSVKDDDVSSNYSKRSSMTSMDGNSPTEVKPISLHSRSGSISYSIHSPVAAGVFDEATSIAPLSIAPESTAQDVEICLQVPLFESPVLGLHQPPPTGQKAHDILGLPRPTPQRALTSSIPIRQHSGIKRRASTRKSRKMRASMTRLDLLERSGPKKLPPTPPSPTLSEAENDLEQHLTSITDDNPFTWDDVVNRTPPTPPSENDDLYEHPPPALPRKSSKRASFLSPTSSVPSRCSSTHIVSQYRRTPSRHCPTANGRGHSLTVAIPGSSKRMTDDFTFSPIPIPEPTALERNITPEVAEGVILSILQSLESLDDLFATAVVNKGFYRVFKRHELSLMKRALRKMSPPAWEHREICPPDNEEEDLEMPKQADYTPTTYLQYYIRDMYIIAALKSLILDQCQSFLRPETAAALASNDQMESSRVDDTFWRIWSFCKLFGSGKGREDDIVAQMDWLKGGALVHQQTCRSTILTSHSYDVSSFLATAPDHFAMGNEGGLTAEQLYDMTELWNCLGVLLQGFEGRTEQARKHGVFEPTEVRGGDIDGEELMLEEWYYYLLTLGLSTILDLATPSKLPDASVFVLAAENEWTHWKVPEHGGSRKAFLKEAVARVYEEKIAASFSSQAQKEMLRQLSKQRIQNHILEIRKRKMTGESREVRMSQERPMSNWESVFTRFEGPRALSQASRVPSMRYPPPASPLPAVPELNHAAQKTLAQPPPLEQHPAFVQHPVPIQHPLQQQIMNSGNAENTAEKAIYRIVEMGFTADQARYALRMTDMGDGLRVDRAVELLLRA